MYEQKLKNIKKSFGVTQDVLNQRAEVSVYIESLSSLIVDKFYDYLLISDEFAKMINKDELPRLKKMRSESIVSLFSDPFDENLIKKMETTYQNSPLAVNSYMVATIFELITQTILDVSSVNAELKKNIKVILKFLRIAEFVMQQSIVNEQKKKLSVSTETTLREVFETLYMMFMVHQERHSALEKAFHTKMIENSYELLPSKDVKKCEFHILIERAKSQYGRFDEVVKDIDKIEQSHGNYHLEIAKLYDMVEQNRQDEVMNTQMEVIKKTSKELFELLTKPFENSASLTFLAIKSGMKFLKHFGEKLGAVKHIPCQNNDQLLVFMVKVFEESIADSLAWAIQDYKFSPKKLEDKWDIEEELVLQNVIFYLYINIKDIPYKGFLKDTLKTFLEVFSTILINKEKEYRLSVLADRAESANRSKDMFLANMSHELRTPLNAIIGFSQILQVKQEIPDNLKPYIQKISIAGNNLLNIVNTILDFAKLEAGKISFHPKMVFLSQLIEEVMVVVTPMAQNKGITLSFPSEISLGLYIDQQLIKQVLVNILSNAIKFTPEGGEVKFEIAFDGAKKSYRLSVCDNGVGIAKEDMAKLFQAFSQVDNSMQSASKGTGLGLVIVKKIIEDLHQGEVWVESEVGKGSCFYFTIPVSQNELFVEILASKSENAKKLLIVEDSKEYVDILAERLSPHYNIAVTNSIMKAKELIQNNTYDVMVLDFFLIDGISSDLLSFMEYNNIEIPTYIISAEDDFKIVEHIQESQTLAGIFNKKDVETICEHIMKASDG